MKKVLFVILGIILLGVAALWFIRTQTKKHSPEADATFSKDGLTVHVHYCRPYKKGRLVFGPKEEKALQPYGQYWRVGANEATTFETSKDILFAGAQLKAGKYNLYAYPGKDNWEVCLGSDWDRWGFNEAPKDKELVRVQVPADNDAPLEEQFLISFEEEGTMVLHWDKTSVRVPISLP